MKIHSVAACLGLSTFVLIGIKSTAQSIPTLIVGRWRIQKILPTHNPQCWDEDEAKALIGNTLTYQAHAMTWRGGTEPISYALSRTQNRSSFMEEYKVDLPELGITAQSVEEIDLQHEDADVTGATTEIPGDTILVAGRGRIVVSACGVFYSAIRVADKPVGTR